MTLDMPRKVVLVDDHSAVRAGYRLLLENDPALTVVAEYSSGEEANQHIANIDVDIVVMDLSMPGMGEGRSYSPPQNQETRPALPGVHHARKCHLSGTCHESGCLWLHHQEQRRP